MPNIKCNDSCFTDIKYIIKIGFCMLIRMFGLWYKKSTIRIVRFLRTDTYLIFS